MRILGIDPGSAATGYGVIERREGRLLHIAHGTLRPARASSLGARLDHLHRGIAQILSEQRPDCVAIERVFVAVSPASALVLGQARGALLAAVGGAQLPIAEFTATEVKRALAGNGHAGKAQIQAMVQRLLGLEGPPPSDAADALAVAIRQALIGRIGLPARLRLRARRRPAGSARVRLAR